MSRSINDEIRRLQKTHALLICIQCAADDEVDFNIADALAVVVKLIDKSIAGLDRLQLREAAP
jgi:hypothetical protein